MTNMKTWNVLKVRMEKIEGAIKEYKKITKEKERWRLILIRIIVKVKFLAKQNLAFRGKMKNSIKITMIIS